MTFRGLLLTKDDDGVHAAVTDLDDNQLPDHEIFIRVTHSTINYKDGMAIMGRPGIVRDYPMVPGVDVVGTVSGEGSDQWPTGTLVTINGFDVGEAHWGGLAQRARMRAEWLTRVPVSMTASQAAAIGTAGYTAMLCVMMLDRNGVKPADGEILVTGAAGGVGSVAISVLSSRGYDVVASTGRTEESDYLKGLGAKEIIDRTTLGAPGKPMQRERWAGVVDSVGSYTLANACAQTQYRGTVAACGLAQGMDFPATVAPFILRGVKLIGVDSVMCPNEDRLQAWNHLADELDIEKLNTITTKIGLSDAIAKARDILGGKIRGRLVVDVNA